MTPTSGDMWLDTANRIAERIIEAAQWHRESCTWTIRVPDRAPGARTAHSELASGTFYQGTTGIAMFLLELYRLTGARDALRTAAGAVEYALAAPALPDTSFGFYSGRAGLAYACYRFGVVAEQSDYLLRAENLLRPLAGMERQDRTLDVIGGAAGAIPVLLQMTDRLPRQLTRDVAIALGEHIIDASRRWPIGWSWTGTASSVRDLTGYAHGASGFGHALVELFQATGDNRFRYGAEQAFAYERRFFSSGARNWPDFRYMEISEYLAYGHIVELRQRMLNGDSIPPFTATYGTTWCHGAPGIGLARLRAFEILGDPLYREEASVAASTTCAITRAAPSNYSLCHGHLGNCETLLYAARILGDAELGEAAEHRALIGRQHHEIGKRLWPCGTLGSAPDPSLMLGEAGIGYFYLRLYDNTTPSLLCMTPSPPPAPFERETRSAAELRLNCVNQYFATTWAVLDRLLPGALQPADPVATSSRTNHVAAAYNAIEALIESQEEQGDLQALLLDAFAIERTRFSMLDAANEELAAELLVDATRLADHEVSWEDAVFQRDTRVAIVRTRRDWGRWLEDEPSAPFSDEDHIATAVWRASGFVRVCKLTPFAALVIDSTVEAGDLAAITRRVATQVDPSAVDRLASAVITQVKSAFRAGLIRCRNRTG